jgi:hypothetical protein
MIDLVKKLVDFILHIDRHLAEIIAEYGTWTYAVLFLIIFRGNGPGGDALSAGRLAPVRRRCVLRQA